MQIIGCNPGAWRRDKCALIGAVCEAAAGRLVNTYMPTCTGNMSQAAGNMPQAKADLVALPHHAACLHGHAPIGCTACRLLAPAAITTWLDAWQISRGSPNQGWAIMAMHTMQCLEILQEQQGPGCCLGPKTAGHELELHQVSISSGHSVANGE